MSPFYKASMTLACHCKSMNWLGFAGCFARAQGNMHRECRAFARRAFDRQTPAVPVEHVLDQRKTQPGPTLRAAVGDIYPVKSLGQPWKMLGRNTRPIV